MANQRENTNILPQEIIFKILTKLPVKSLFRFQTVRKQWQASISSQKFVEEHLRHAKDINSYTFHKFMYLRVYFSTRKVSSKFFDFSSFKKVPVTLPFGNEYVSEVVASCDGLLLLCKNLVTYILWNPSTREYREILGLHKNVGITFCFRLYGIVYDASADSYKVIACARVDNQRGNTVITVYSCRTDSCAYSTNFLYWIHRNQQGVIVNETLHWLVSHREGDGCAIIYYDLGDETFKEVPKPDWAENVYEFELRAHKGLLCLVHYRRGYADIWVMENYGKQESWTKMYPYVRCPGDFKMRPLGLTRNNQVVMEMEDCKVDIYDPSTRSFSNKNIFTYHNDGFNAAAYVESLVSPNSTIENQ